MWKTSTSTPFASVATLTTLASVACASTAATRAPRSAAKSAKRPWLAPMSSTRAGPAGLRLLDQRGDRTRRLAYISVLGVRRGNRSHDPRRVEGDVDRLTTFEQAPQRI
mgnify:CR=1 FL=1